MSAALAEAVPFDWENPPYQLIWAQRARHLALIRSNPSYFAARCHHYKHERGGIADFIGDWGVTVNPKNVGTGRPVVMPFVLFPKQREFVDWVIDRWHGHENGVLVKSRECGASWMAMSISVAICLFWEDVNIGFGSAKEEFVDRSGDPNCLFYKGRKFLENLPSEFKRGWDIKKNSANMRILVPWMNSSIVGGAGDNIGVGGRSSLFFIDEYAIIERPKLIETNLSANTDSRIEMSTVRGVANVFAEHARGGLMPRFDFSYRDDPTKVDPLTGEMREGFKKHIADMDPVIFNQEYGCDFLASIEGGVLEATHINAAIGAAERLGVAPTGERVASLDVADLGADKNAINIRHGIELLHAEQWSGNNSNPMQTIRHAFELCDKYDCRRLIYDAAGMGGTWHEYFAIANREREANGQRPIECTKFQGGAAVMDPESRAPGSDRKNIDYFENLKAQGWMAIRQRFVGTFKALQGETFNPEDIISINPSIPILNLLCSELAQPTRKWSKNGKLMIDKTPDGMASPNNADAAMMNFGYSRPPLNFSDDTLAALS